MFLRNRKEVILCNYFDKIKVFGWQAAFFSYEVVLVLQTPVQVLIFMHGGTMDFDKATHMSRAEYLCVCWVKNLCFTGMNKYLFASSLQPHEFLIFNFQTFMEEILWLHISADNALNLFALKDVWLLLELNILWSSYKSAFGFFLLMHPP